MSWNAYLTDDRGHQEGDWNFTHNTNGMIEAVLGEEIAETNKPWFASKAMGSGSWWDLLDGCTGAEGASLLARIVTSLKSEPERFRAMNPENGWGNYDSLVKVLTAMCEAVPEWPTVWSVHG
jgi:hypothetical protein